MFKSYKIHSRVFSKNSKYIIIDDDFEELIEVNNKEFIMSYFIKIYEKRNLNVAANIYLWLKYLEIEFAGTYDMLAEDHLIIKEYIPYHDQVSTYYALE